ncbi:Serine/threonine-protein kinase HAL4/SAT4 [Spathaspora sp. JA1]|nr:Serine/threonine-protein kinase HAL4/SAT4 [Spathaspora sp. JA1]
MPLFRSKKEDPPPAATPQSRQQISRSNSIVSVTSNTNSIHSTTSTTKLGGSTNKLKSFFKNNSKVLSVDTTNVPLSPASSSGTTNNTTPSSPSPSPYLSPSPQSPIRQFVTLNNRRVSTIEEREGDDNDDSEFDEECSDENQEEENYTQEPDSDDEQEEDHLHPIKPRFQSSHGNLAEHLSTIMGYCGMSSLMNPNQQQLTHTANQESKRTYSLLDHRVKIHKLNCSMIDKTSVIGDDQVELINSLTTKLTGLFEKHNIDSFHRDKKSLYDKYGVVRNLIGKGAYGVIKIVDPNVASIKPDVIPTTRQKLYVVKELKRRKVKETDGKFIERILSEFVVASTLNYKHIVETVDLMITQYDGDIKLSQVMQCSQGGDLFTYLTTGQTITNKPVSYMSLYEVDCFIKQIAKGLKYMHNHGVAHCDLKLENILLTYEGIQTGNTKIMLKLSDFGKSFVFKTKFDSSEQLIPGEQGPIGSTPYMAPEEHISHQLKRPYSSRIKDYWGLGILIVVLLNIRRYYYSGKDENDYNIENRVLERGTSSGYLWQTTDLKHHHITHSISQRDFQDKWFNLYAKNRMIADYDCPTKEWLVKQPANFAAIDNICKLVPRVYSSDDNSSIEQQSDDSEHEEEEIGDELNELRVMIIYKLLDIDPKQRMTVDEFLKSDWMTSTEACS